MELIDALLKEADHQARFCKTIRQKVCDGLIEEKFAFTHQMEAMMRIIVSEVLLDIADDLKEAK